MTAREMQEVADEMLRKLQLQKEESIPSIERLIFDKIKEGASKGSYHTYYKFREAGIEVLLEPFIEGLRIKGFNIKIENDGSNGQIQISWSS